MSGSQSLSPQERLAGGRRQEDQLFMGGFCKLKAHIDIILRWESFCVSRQFLLILLVGLREKHKWSTMHHEIFSPMGMIMRQPGETFTRGSTRENPLPHHHHSSRTRSISYNLGVIS